MFPPSRIICLTEETVETLYLLGEQDRIVGISGYVVRPPQARREKPRVSAFTSAKIGKILSLQPDLVLTFSDLQADIATDLIRRGIEVHAFNQRTVTGIHDHLPYSELQFFPKLAAFNIGWHERPKRRIDSFIPPRGCLTRPGMESHEGDHSQAYSFFPRYSREAPMPPPVP